METKIVAKSNPLGEGVSAGKYARNRRIDKSNTHHSDTVDG